MAKPLETFLTEPGTVLAFDFGLARTGVAVGNTVTRTAEPLVILDASTNESRWQSIEALMSEWKPKFLVVGVPRLGDGNPSTLTARCERSVNSIHLFQKERLSAASSGARGLFCSPLSLLFFSFLWLAFFP